MYHCIAGAPIFIPENRNVMHGELGERLTLTFFIHSDPLLDDVWIQSVGTDCNQNRTEHKFNMSNTTLSYTAFGNRGNISGNEITVDTNIKNSDDFRLYCICAKNELGLDFFIFEIKLFGRSVLIDRLWNSCFYSLRSLQ